MTEAETLVAWMEKINRCKGRKEIFAVLDDFRKHEWSDEECSQMGKHYIRIISAMPEEKSSDDDKAKGGEGEKEADGPVWYEKM